MEEKELSELTDQELLDKAKKLKSDSFTNAVFIGFLIGIVIYSIVMNGFGFFILIPLFIAYKLITNSKKDNALKKLLKERDLE
ncbi:FUSC family protein [Polaribacter batillariae]|uniref:FUSC family protein n=1 Tax=Polaribacter batillariae TaxID=2808900 RepID=A0ABX7SRF9_9FLAO|nr:FUSC family protein [Polaribacter batillariae]QTD36447.1 FUSC family protein [Polaribacter batillariae]